MVLVISRGEDFVFVDVVDFEGFKDLVFNNVVDVGFGYDGDGDGGLDFFDYFWVGYVGDIVDFVDVGGDVFEGYDGDGVGFFGDVGLFDVGDVYDDVVFEYLGEVGFDGEVIVDGGDVVGEVGGYFDFRVRFVLILIGKSVLRVFLVVRRSVLRFGSVGYVRVFDGWWRLSWLM